MASRFKRIAIPLIFGILVIAPALEIVPDPAGFGLRDAARHNNHWRRPKAAGAPQLAGKTIWIPRPRAAKSTGAAGG